jgi:O-acetyl-ADP-ribose deacetylase (regulator of RNase III)
MHEITGDLFESEQANAICILTNGFVNAQGSNTMGKGCALGAKQRWPGVQLTVGNHIRDIGNVCRVLTVDGSDEWKGNICLVTPKPIFNIHLVPYHILTFPTKRHWKEQAELKLIERSCMQLMTHVDTYGWKSVVLPRPGCGAGGLLWEDEVRPLISTILDERIYVIDFER